MSDAAHVHDLQGLRARLRARLRQVIGQPGVEAKELAAFDVIMGRRQFLRATQYTAIAGLVAAGTPPTLWGRTDPTLAVDRRAVGLTIPDERSVAVATELTVGTELFEETVYASPVVSPEAVNTHAVIEGARGRLKLQSDLTSSDPKETSAFLDTGYHYGPPELVQLEQSGVNYSLVHYRNPWTTRTDGATTDGTIGHVIIETDALVSPTQVLTMTAPSTNEFAADGTMGVTYFVVVIDPENDGGGLLCVGHRVFSPPDNQDGTQPTYDLKWDTAPLAGLNISDQGLPLRAAKYTDLRYGDVSSSPAPTESIVVYNEPFGGENHAVNEIVVLTFDDEGQGQGTLNVRVFRYPDGTKNWSLVHLGDYAVLAQTSNDESGSGTYTYRVSMAEIELSSGQAGSGGSLGDGIDYREITYAQDGYATKTTNAPSTVGEQPDFAGVLDVHALYTVEDDTGRQYHVKLARSCCEVVLFLVTNRQLQLAGVLPLKFPDVDGHGEPITLSGGVSKFGGMRFVITDSVGNLYLMRQRRNLGATPPYDPAIYGPFDATGQPRTTYSSSTRDPNSDPEGSTVYPPELLKHVQSSVQDQAVTTASYNVLLNAALAFGTETPTQIGQPPTVSNASQGVCLGTGLQAAYAPARFAHDSAHVEVKRKQGSTTEYAAYLAQSNPVTKTWHERQIAVQVEPTSQLKEPGDHYQAIVAGANAYGRPVSLASAENSSLLIEVRADAPTMVVDDTHNLYYDVDRYTSFMAAPDPGSGRLGLVVKAATFAQVLYVRLVDTSGLQPSEGDAAMLASTGVTTYPWQTVNMAAQAQQRMSNDGKSTVLDLLGDAAPVKDTTQYISSQALEKSSKGSQTSPAWDFKGNYTPSADNLGSLATYLNTSGQNLIAVTPQLGLGASENGAIDPLTAVSAVSADTLVASAVGTTTFTYPRGSIGSGASTSPPDGQLGSIWSGISHALHDALHWLQNVEEQAYNDLATGAVTVAMTTESITCTVSADIMKAVNGVDKALTEAVSTVEEYANVLANLVVTIVEQSFLYKLIELIVALISLFVHLQDIKDLRTSLYNEFTALQALPTGSSWDAFGSDYIGTDNALTNADAVNDGASSSVPDELVTGLVDAVSGNPLTKKILNKVMAFLSQYLGDVLPEPPIEFDLPTSLADDFLADVETLEQILITDVVNLAADAMQDLMNTLVEDIEDPQATYSNLTDTLAGLADEIGRDVEQVFDWVDGVIDDAVSDAQAAIGTDDYISLTIPSLADLLALFLTIDAPEETLKLSGKDAVFFPMALVIWVTVYMKDGTSISEVSELSSGASALGADASRWTIARLVVDGVMAELGGGVWSVSKLVDSAKNPKAGPWIAAAGAWYNLIRWANDLVYTLVNLNPKLPDWLYLGARTYFAVVSAVLTLPTKGLNPGNGWNVTPKNPKPTDLVNLTNAVLTIAIMGYDTAEVAANNPPTAANPIAGVVGQDLSRTQPLATTIYDLFLGDNPPQEATLAWAAYVGIIPAVGWVLQGMAAAGEFSDPPTDDRPGNDNPNRQGPPDGRPRRRHREDPPGRARRRRPTG